MLFTERTWGLALALNAAAVVLDEPRHAAALVEALSSEDALVRRRAADAARRVTEKNPELLAAYAERILDALAGALAQPGAEDWRMLAHTGLVAARVARSKPQRLRAAGLLRPLLHDPSNVVRCTAIEGLGLLASLVPMLRREVEPILEEALVCGTTAMRCRARAALRLLGP